MEREEFQFRLKAMDHAFEAARASLDIYLKIGTLYLALMTIFFVAFTNDSDAAWTNEFRILSLLATAVMFILGCVFYRLTKSSIKAYLSLAQSLAPQSEVKHWLEADRRLGRSGKLLLAFSLLLLSVAAGVILATIWF